MYKIIRLSLSTEEGLTLKLSAPLKINLMKLKLLCKVVLVYKHNALTKLNYVHLQYLDKIN